MIKPNTLETQTKHRYKQLFSQEEAMGKPKERKKW